MEEDYGVFHFKNKWDVDKALELLQFIAYKPGNYNTLGKAFESVKAYIGILEIEVKSYYNKEKENGLRI